MTQGRDLPAATALARHAPTATEDTGAVAGAVTSTSTNSGTSTGTSTSTNAGTSANTSTNAGTSTSADTDPSAGTSTGTSATIPPATTTAAKAVPASGSVPHPEPARDTGPAPAATAGLPTVYLCGPIAEGGEAARGGYQACNRRTIAALRRDGLTVEPLPYPHPRTRGWRKQAEYVLGFLRLYARLLFAGERGAILHLTALAAHFAYNEWPLVMLARLRGLRVVYDLRAGAAALHWEGRSAFYRATFRACLRAADALLVEGEALVPFVERVSGRRATWLPNHLEVEALPWRDPFELPLPAAPTLAYVGRIVPEKGVEVLLEAARRLRARGLPVRVRIAGDGDEAYLARLRARADEAVEWVGALPPAAVLALWREAHFFVFATRHVGEGQSNALTEAMASGCVPVASRHGFNADVVGEAGALLPVEAAAEPYAQAIERLWPGAWPALSQLAQSRARERFSTRAAVGLLLRSYRAACSSRPPADGSRAPA